MGYPKNVNVSDEERVALESIVRSPTAEYRTVVRARIILLLADGLTNQEVAERVGLSPVAVSKWRGRFADQRLAGLNDGEGRGRKKSIPEEIVRKVIEESGKPRPDGGVWSNRTLAKHLGIGKSSVNEIWKAHNLKPHITKGFKV